MSTWNVGGTLFVGTAIWKLFLDVEGETFRMEAYTIGLLSNGFVAVENRRIEETIWWCGVVNVILAPNGFCGSVLV